MKNVTIALLALLLGACVSTSGDARAPTPAPATTTFVLVRHAEKVADGSDDPALTTAGEQRAQALVHTLENTPLSAVYATALRRAQQTAAPTAKEHGLPVITYDAKQSAAEFASRLRADNAGGIVLVVGHSNTVPGIAAALCGCEVRAMSEAEYDRLTTVRIDASGKATLEETRQH